MQRKIRVARVGVSRQIVNQVIGRADFAEGTEIKRVDRGIGRERQIVPAPLHEAGPVFGQSKSERGGKAAGRSGLGAFRGQSIEREIEPAICRQLEALEERRPVGRVLPRMKNSPNDSGLSRPGEVVGKEEIVDSSLRQRGKEEKQTPKRAAHEAGIRRSEKPGDRADREDDEGGDAPASIARITQPEDAREQDERRDDRDEKQDVVEIDQDFQRRVLGDPWVPCDLYPMRLLITNYLDVISSWCHWAIPAWQEVRARYGDRVDFRWKIALMDKTGLPPTREVTEWYYQAQRPAHALAFLPERELVEEGRAEYPEPNCIAEAARDLGVEDDRAWIALSQAELRKGKKIGQLGNRRPSRRGGDRPRSEQIARARQIARDRSPHSPEHGRISRHAGDTTPNFCDRYTDRRPRGLLRLRQGRPAHRDDRHHARRHRGLSGVRRAFRRPAHGINPKQTSFRFS